MDKAHCIVARAVLAGLVLAGQDLTQAAQRPRLLGVHEPFILHDAVRPCPKRVRVLRRVLGDAQAIWILHLDCVELADFGTVAEGVCRGGSAVAVGSMSAISAILVPDCGEHRDWSGNPHR